MIRFVLALLCLGAITPPNLNSQIVDRVWRVGDEQIEAKVSQLCDGVVELRTMDRQDRTLAIDSLSEKDKQYLVESIQEVINLDRRQFEAVSEVMDTFVSNSEMTLQTLRQLEGSPVRSPYASLALGVAKAIREGDHQGAGRYFGKALKAIKNSRKLLGENYLDDAFKSSINNSGVIAVKKLKGDSASSFFMQAMTEGKLPFSIHHNAGVLLNVANQQLNVELKSKAKRDLASLIKSECLPGIQVSSTGDSFLYDLTWEAPPDDVELNLLLNGLELPEIPVVHEDDREPVAEIGESRIFADPWCTACRGKGSYSCNAEDCVKGKVMRKTLRQTGIGPNNRPIYMSVWVIDHTCTTCGGSNKVKCHHCYNGRAREKDKE